VPSLRRQPRTEPRDQFPKLTLPETDRAHHHDHANLTYRTAQCAQRACTVPVHTHMLRSRASHDRARRPAPDSTPPTPCPRVAQTNPGEPGFRRTRSEPEATMSRPFRH
jgi:hypothetical protein